MIHPLESDAPAIVYVDVKSPYAFVAIEPTLALEARLGMRFDWRPLTLDIPSYLGSARKNARGDLIENNRSASQWSAVKYAYRDARRYAALQGFELRGTQKIWDSSIANIAILWVTQRARENLGAYLKSVYPPFWQRALDIENVSAVMGILQRCGVAAEGFAEFALGEGRELHDTLQGQLHGHGIYGVPTYVVDGEVSFGREHLPYVTWQLTGRKGAAPDIAYLV